MVQAVTYQSDKQSVYFQVWEREELKNDGIHKKLRIFRSNDKSDRL